MADDVIKRDISIGKQFILFEGKATDISWLIARMREMNIHGELDHLSTVKVRGFFLDEFRAEFDEVLGSGALAEMFPIQAGWSKSSQAFLICRTGDSHNFPVGSILPDEEKKQAEKVPS